VSGEEHEFDETQIALTKELHKRAINSKTTQQNADSKSDDRHNKEQYYGDTAHNAGLL
jgi:hypothetical protein